MQRTEQIQGHIGKVKDTAAEIERNISDTAQKVVVGREQMDALFAALKQILADGSQGA